MKVKTPAKLFNTVVSMAAAVALSFGLSGNATATENSCTANPFNPASGDVAGLVQALQRATNTGQAVTITGTFTIDEPIKIVVRRDLTVDATGASFRAAEGLNGDMFSLDVVETSSDTCRYSDGRNANVTWTGGNFEFSKALNSTTVPIQSRVPASRQGTEATADALSIRGAWNNGPQRIDNAIVNNVLMRGTIGAGKTAFDAGGDSGVFMSSVKRGEVNNSQFYGIRDAAIYVSANNSDATMRSEFHLVNNIIKRVYDGISSKRGADGIVMRLNYVEDSAVALSIKENISGRLASNITIDENQIVRSVRGILLENTRNTRVTNNTLRSLGGLVAGSESPLGGGGKYRGVIFEGLGGTDNELIDNTFNGDGSTAARQAKTVIAVSNTSLNGKRTRRMLVLETPLIHTSTSNL